MTAYKTVLLLMGVISMGCNSYAAKPTETNLSDNARQVANGNNCFALQLYQRLQGEKGNLFFSPYSISTALAMTYAGARGRTQEQMAQTLCLPTSKEVVQKLAEGREPLAPEDFAKAFGKIIKDLNARGDKGTYELRVANALWGQQDFEFLPSFAKLVEDRYDGHLERVDFVQAAEKARQTINAWVEKQTNGKIKDLIGPGLLDSMTRLVLTNAVYFKGTWASQFQKEGTQDGPFTLLDGSQVQAPMMNQQARFGYAEADGLQVLEMPYVGQELSMVVLLPKESAGIGDLEKALTAENVSKWLGGIRKQEVIVAVPKFKMTHKFSLGDVLQAMGMTDAFSRQADFSGMTGRRDLFISAVVHQAYVDVNEEGTEAAAATGVTMKLTAIAPGRIPVFRADHPFLFLIRDIRSGSILFLGRMMNPKG
ncbi:MAG: serpin family protein [Planctomycetes bacterium]|nr:serpin family protein [Planctomycetota bacterium]